MSMSTPEFESTSAARLAEFLESAAGEEGCWGPEDLGGLLRHQLSAPLEFDPGDLSENAARRAQQALSHCDATLGSFRDLFQHPNPPLDLLRLTKWFAKSSRSRINSPLPREIATLLYFAAIAAAYTRCQTRITQLDDAALREGLEWGAQQCWVDDETRSLFQEALRALESPRVSG